MKRIFFLSGMLCMILLLSSCGIGSPSENDLMEYVPSEVLNYYFDGQQYTSKVSEMTLIRRQTNEKVDTADCEFILTGGPLVRKIGLTMTSGYYDKGGWMLDSYELLSPERWEFSDDAGDAAVYDVANMEYYLFGNNEINFTKTVLEDTPGHLEVQFSFEDKHANINIYGDIFATANLESFTENSSSNYYWAVSYDNDNIVYDWSPIIGTWTADGMLQSWTSMFEYVQNPTLTIVDIGGSIHYGAPGVAYLFSYTQWDSFRKSASTKGGKETVIYSTNSFEDEYISFGLRYRNDFNDECIVYFYYDYAKIKQREGSNTLTLVRQS